MTGMDEWIQCELSELHSAAHHSDTAVRSPSIYDRKFSGQYRGDHNPLVSSSPLHCMWWVWGLRKRQVPVSFSVGWQWTTYYNNIVNVHTTNLSYIPYSLKLLPVKTFANSIKYRAFRKKKLSWFTPPTHCPSPHAQKFADKLSPAKVSGYTVSDMTTIILYTGYSHQESDFPMSKLITSRKNKFIIQYSWNIWQDIKIGGVVNSWTSNHHTKICPFFVNDAISHSIPTCMATAVSAVFVCTPLDFNEIMTAIVLISAWRWRRNGSVEVNQEREGSSHSHAGNVSFSHRNRPQFS